MLLDLSRLPSGVEHIERRSDPSALALGGEDFRLVTPVSLTADVRKDARKVRLVGRVTSELECSCSRCLDPFVVPVDVAFDLLFLPASTNTGDGEQQVGEDDLGVAFYKDDVIDLGEVVREQFYLAMPMKPLCREDCRGLCPVCGVNWNHESCACQPAWVDPRLEGLKKLVKRQE